MEKSAHEDDNPMWNFKGLYFDTPDMRNSMAAWPEIVSLDGTYKLTDRNFTVMLLIVQDSNDRAEVVGVALFASDDKECFEWFLNTFKAQNLSASENIKCFMSDKHLMQREILGTLFPGVPRYICLYHTLKIFERELKNRKHNMSLTVRDQCMKLLKQLAKSKSTIEYDELYEKFCECAPATLQSYYNKNWHAIREDWTTFNMSQGNLMNRTNNRLESLNGKLKQVVDKNSALLNFLKSFFQWLASHNSETDYETSQNFLTKPACSIEKGSCESKYMEYLTTGAFSRVSKEIEASKRVKIGKRIPSTNCYATKWKGIALQVSSSSCTCRLWTSNLLPCRHILSLRKKLNLLLFDEDICHARWTKNHLESHQRSFCSLNLNTQNRVKSLHFSTCAINGPLSKSKKKKKIQPIMDDFIHIISLSCGYRFGSKIEIIKQIEKLWIDGKSISILKKDSKITERDQSQKEKKQKASQSVTEKRKIVKPIIESLSNIVLSANRFDSNMMNLRELQEIWRRGDDVDVYETTVDTCKPVDYVNSLINLSLDDDEREDTQNLLEKIKHINVLPPVRILGHPSKSMDTTVSYRSKKSTKNNNKKNVCTKKVVTE